MKNIGFFIIILIFSFKNNIYSAHDFNNLGARSGAMGGASVALFDFWAINNNQAGIAEIKKPTVGIYFQNRYLIKELSLKSFAMVYPLTYGTIGCNINHFGYKLYNETNIGLAYAKTLGKIISAGVKLNYLRNYVDDIYGTRQNIMFEIGLIAKIHKNITIGTHIYNPTRTYIVKETNEQVPTVINFGISSDINEKVIVSSAIEKDLKNKLSFKFGVEYNFINKMYIRTGISTQPIVSSFGFGLNYSKFSLDLSANYQSPLGFTNSLNINYKF